MLSDKQVNDLENLIVFSTMDNLPLVLSRAIPLLFSELRLVRATLDSRVGDFLGGIHAEAASEREKVDQGSGHSGLRERPERVEGGQEVPRHGHAEGSAGVAGGNDTAQGLLPSGRRRRGRPKKVGSPSQLDAGAGQQALGGPTADQTRDDALLGIEASPRLNGGA